MPWKFTAKVLAYLLFWGWNALLLSIFWFGFGPIVVVEMARAAVLGLIPVSFVLFSFAVLGVPVLACSLAAFTRLRSDPGRLLSMFYGVQIPVMLLLLIRIFAIHELVWSTSLALVVVGLGGLGLLRTLFHGPGERWASLTALRLVSASGLLMVGIWWAVLAALFFLPVVAWALLAALQSPLYFLESLDPRPIVVLFPFFMFGLLTTAMLGVMPFATFGIAARNFQLVNRAARQRWGRGAWLFSGLTFAALAAAFLLPVPPQAETFETLRAVQDDAARRAIEGRLDAMREGLVAARIGTDRFFDFDGEQESTRDMWDDFVGTTLAQGPQSVANFLMRPLSYQRVDSGTAWTASGRRPKDVVTAAQLYAEVFDAPMEVAEQEALLRSATYTWSWETAEAGLLDIGQRKVFLDRQTIELTPDGDLATVTVHDEWRNHTFDRQEIRLSFDLPETAAVTGLWLGTTDDKDDAFAYIVAPRGAAQEVHESEVQRRVDPALLEQVGPRQYRLRAFPVEPRTTGRGELRAADEQGPPLHVWMEYVTPSVDGAFPLPVLSETRNAYWNDDSVRTVDGQPVVATSWTPEAIGTAGPRVAREAIVNGLRVRATPDAPSAPVRRSMDVILDGSASMRDQRAAIEEALQTLQATHDVSVFCVIEQALGRCDRERDDRVFWGHAAVANHLVDWAALDRSPSAVVVLTDAGSYSLLGSLQPEPEPRRRGDSPRPPAPLTIEAALPDDIELPELWLVHLDSFPAAYPDWTLDRLQRSGGGVVGSATELVARMADPAVVDGRRFTVEPALEGAYSAPSAFDSLAARAAIRHIAREGRGQLEQLDQLHALAVDQHVVTAWSSMIVLVNDRQKERLKKASEDADRFEREATDGPAAAVNAAPEPATWLLLFLGGGLAVGARKRRTLKA
jgi:putative PEP-CTERM system integral membrane protein